MSTRGAIARLTHVLPAKWAGRYHHWDSYPSGLGATLWNLYHGHFNRDLNQMLKVLIDDHPAGWSSLNASDFAQEPGFIEPLGPAHEGESASRPQCYCHGERQEEGWLVTDENASGSGCEWAYAFTSASATDEQRHHTMLVLSSYTPGGKMIGMFGQGDPTALWPVVAIVDLNGAEPDWDRLEEAEPLDPTFSHDDFARHKPAGNTPLVHYDRGRRGTYIVRSAKEPPHYVAIHNDDSDRQIFCTCSPQEEAESPNCPHAKAVLNHLEAQRAKAKERQQRGLEYSGSRVQTGEGRNEVMVLVTEAGWPRLLDPKPGQCLNNHSPSGFEWGYAGSGPAQLALSILLDFCGEEEFALNNYQAFKNEFVALLPREDAIWKIISTDISTFLQGRLLAPAKE